MTSYLFQTFPQLKDLINGFKFHHLLIF